MTSRLLIVDDSRAMGGNQMAKKKTSSRKASRSTSHGVRYKRTTSTKKKKLARDEFGRKSRAAKRHVAKAESRAKDIVSPKSARAIRKEVGVTPRDRKVARRAMSRA